MNKNIASVAPQSTLKKVPPEQVGVIVTDLKQLYDMGRPVNNQDFAERINLFFNFCSRSNLRPGIETLCMALHCSRKTFWQWCAGQGADDEKQRLCKEAKSFISAYLEQAGLQGKINPISFVWLQKVWCGYSENHYLSGGEDDKGVHSVMSLEDIEKNIPLEDTTEEREAKSPPASRSIIESVPVNEDMPE